MTENRLNGVRLNLRQDKKISSREWLSKCVLLEGLIHISIVVSSLELQQALAGLCLEHSKCSFSSIKCALINIFVLKMCPFHLHFLPHIPPFITRNLCILMKLVLCWKKTWSESLSYPENESKNSGDLWTFSFCTTSRSDLIVIQWNILKLARWTDIKSSWFAADDFGDSLIFPPAPQSLIFVVLTKTSQPLLNTLPFNLVEPFTLPSGWDVNNFFGPSTPPSCFNLSNYLVFDCLTSRRKTFSLRSTN